MPTPNDAITAITTYIKANGVRSITGPVLAGVLLTMMAVIATMGTWNSSGVYTPNIPDGAITAPKLAPGVGGTVIGSDGDLDCVTGQPCTVLTIGGQALNAIAFTGIPNGYVTQAMLAAGVGGSFDASLARTLTGGWTFNGGVKLKAALITAAGDVTVTADTLIYHLAKTTAENTKFNFNCATLGDGFSFSIIDDNAVDYTFPITPTALPTGATVNGAASYPMNTSLPANGTVAARPDHAHITCYGGNAVAY